MQPFVTLRRLAGRKLLMILVTLIATTGLGVLVAPSPASAAPPYYLYDENRNVVGPCGSSYSLGAYAGSVYFGTPYHYSDGYTSIWWEGDYQVWQYEQQSFSSDDFYYACVNFKFVYRHFGVSKVHRYVTTKYFCLPDFLSCLPAGTTYSSFSGGW